MPCAGDTTQRCGGHLVNSVYAISSSPLYEVRKGEGERPLLALLMIVKDEAHTLGRTLLAIRHLVDVYYILDTGSTDHTIDVIKRVLKNVPGKIFQEPFVDYGTSRNRILDLVEQQQPKPVLQIMLSADETVYQAHELRKFCVEVAEKSGLEHGAYPVVMFAGVKFDSLRLSRVDQRWRYKGKVHEYLAPPEGSNESPGSRVPKAEIHFRITDPERRSQREFTILNVLLEEKKEKPNDTRTSFYLARTYEAVKNYSAALDEYQRRVSLGGWQEEIYESLYAIASQKQKLNYSWPEVQDSLMQAHQHSGRAEPLFMIASHYYDQKDWLLTYLFSLRASQITYPHNAVLWVLSDIYQWKAKAMLAESALHLKEYEVSAKSILDVRSKVQNEAEAERIFHEVQNTLEKQNLLDFLSYSELKIKEPKKDQSPVYFIFIFLLLAVIFVVSKLPKKKKFVRGKFDLLDKSI
jgi:hypothetical protein